VVWPCLEVLKTENAALHTAASDAASTATAATDAASAAAVAAASTSAATAASSDVAAAAILEPHMESDASPGPLPKADESPFLPMPTEDVAEAPVPLPVKKMSEEESPVILPTVDESPVLPTADVLGMVLPTKEQRWAPVAKYPLSPGAISHTDIERYRTPVKDWQGHADIARHVADTHCQPRLMPEIHGPFIFRGCWFF
jgi:hypothetical protein